MPPILPPAPVAVVPKPVEMSRVGGSVNPIASNPRFNTRKKAEQAARKSGGGQKATHYTNPKDGRGPHFHPKGSHDHYYPRSSNYIVKKGDTLGAIAAKYGTGSSEIASYNGIADSNKIFPGQVLKIK